MSHAMGGRPGRPRPTRDTYQPFLVKLKLKLQCYHFCLYGGLRRYNPERLRSHGHGHGRASGTPTPCSRRTPTAFGKAQLSTAPTRHRIPGWSDEVTCLAYLRVRVLCQPTLRPLGMAISSHNPGCYFCQWMLIIRCANYLIDALLIPKEWLILRGQAMKICPVSTINL